MDLRGCPGMLPVGEGLIADGFVADLPLLEGHADGASAIRDVSLLNGESVLQRLGRVYRATGKPVLLVGFSMGGLWFDLAVRTKVPARVVSLAAPLRLEHLLGRLQGWQRQSRGLNRLRGRVSRIGHSERVAIPGADGIPLRAVSELNTLIESVRHTSQA